MITSVLYIVFLRAYKSSLVIRHLSLVIRHYLSIFFIVKALRTR